jgi:hypothetical protein
MSAPTSRFAVFKRAGYLLGTIWLSFGAALLALLLCDAVLRVALKPMKSARVDANAAAAPRESMAANGTDRGYWAEHEAARETEWRPYVYFRRKPYSGKLIHVDANGFRATVNPPLTSGQRAFWLFGGSTVWGTGVSDANTTASQLALRAQGSAQVLNFGETGYVSVQSQLAFMASLRCTDAKRPDVAIFIDGVNDVYAAFQSGSAGTPQNESNRTAEFNATRSARSFASALIQRLQGVQQLRERIEGIPRQAGVSELALRIAKNYLAQAQQTRAIAHAQGIAVLFVWQPSVFDKALISEDERSVIGNSLLRHRDLQLATTRALKVALLQQPQADVLVLDTLFDQNTGAIFIDFAHTGAEGNAILATRLMQQIQPLLAAQAKPEHPRVIAANQSTLADTANQPGNSCRDRPLMPEVKR